MVPCWIYEMERKLPSSKVEVLDVLRKELGIEKR